MSYSKNEDMEVYMKERVDEDLMGFIYSDKRALGDFVCYLESVLSPDEFKSLLDGFIKTPHGGTWYRDQIELLISRNSL